MEVLSQHAVAHLQGIVGDYHYRDDRRERKAYSSDIGVMPALIKPLVKAGIAGGVVRLQTEEELVQIVQYAASEHIELVARAGATSGYGGVLPRKGALVVDLNAFDKVVGIDFEKQVVRCQTAAIWEEVDKQLAKQGLELRLHPSSYPSSTVGGWLAQGGCGFGSFEYGSFKENVISARLVLASGETRLFEGSELLDFVADAEGITGIITEVTFRVREKQEQQVQLLSLPNAAALAGVLTDIRAQQLPIWSMTFLNPESVQLKTLLPPRHSHAFEASDIARELAAEKSLPVSYLLLIAYPKQRKDSIDAPLFDIVKKHGAFFLPAGDARREWTCHTAPMRLKRLGPSIIPTEVVVPLTSLASMLEELDDKIKQALVLEGMVEADGNITILGFIPHDERRAAFNFAFALSLSVIKIAQAHGGRVYSTGLYFRREARGVLGPERLAKLASFKKAVDPTGIMNPGKVFKQPGVGGGLLDGFMGMAMGLEPIIRPFANAARVKLSPMAPAGDGGKVDTINGVPADIAYFATSCARCGYCVPTCEQYQGRGWESQSPRGKYAFIREVISGREKWDRKAVDTFLLCTTCERCDLRCQLQLPVEHNGMALRGTLIEEKGMGTFPPFEMMAASLRGEGDIWAGRRVHRADWLPKDVASRLKPEAEMLYFAGCTASYVETDIAEATIRLLLDSGHDVAYLGTQESCCGIPMKMAGKWDLFTQIYAENVQALRKTGAKTIVTSCPACALVWKELYSEEAKKRGETYDIEVKHYSEVIAPALADGRLTLGKNPFEGQRVTFHDSCHAGRAQGIYEPPRQMLEAIPGLDIHEMEHNRDKGLCCGSVLTLVGEIDKAPVLGQKRLVEAERIGAQAVVAMCPCCQVQLRDAAKKNDMPLVIDDLARVVAEAAGHTIPTSAAQTSYMWGLFDVFIRLMAPKEMASFMQVLFPQMLDAMPLKMGPMMRMMAKLPGGPALMTRMMPVLFPKMAPGILSKVMPDMVEAVKVHVGSMPPDMDELMPDLLPKTMDALMPTYLPQLVPHLVPLFIDYLKNGTTDGPSKAKAA